jgi:hypothetical protein
LVLEIEPAAMEVEVTADDLTVDLADGRRLIVPLAWYPRLLFAKDAERQNWQLLGNGYAIEWPDLDEHIGIEGLLVSSECDNEDRGTYCLSRTPAKKRQLPTEAAVQTLIE